MGEKLLIKIAFFTLVVLPRYMLNPPSSIAICVDRLLAVNSRHLLFCQYILYNPFNAYNHIINFEVATHIKGPLAPCKSGA